MANKLEYVRKIALIVPTPEDKGLMTTLTLRIMDNGIVSINSAPMGGMGGTFPTKEEAISGLHVFIAQVAQDLTQASVRRARSRAAGIKASKTKGKAVERRAGVMAGSLAGKNLRRANRKRQGG